MEFNEITHKTLKQLPFHDDCGSNVAAKRHYHFAPQN